MKRLDSSNNVSGFVLEAGDVIQLQRLEGDDILDDKTDLVLWTTDPVLSGGRKLGDVPMKDILEAVEIWRGTKCMHRLDRCIFLRICDTGELRARVIREVGQVSNIPYRYEVEWLSGQPKEAA